MHYIHFHFFNNLNVKQLYKISCEHVLYLLLEDKFPIKLLGLLKLIFLELFSEAFHIVVYLCDHLDGKWKLKISFFFKLHKGLDFLHINIKTFLFSQIVQALFHRWSNITDIHIVFFVFLHSNHIKPILDEWFVRFECKSKALCHALFFYLFFFEIEPIKVIPIRSSW